LGRSLIEMVMKNCGIFALNGVGWMKSGNGPDYDTSVRLAGYES
jgi:hypothetical protein